jgi:hypothetical protein
LEDSKEKEDPLVDSKDESEPPEDLKVEVEPASTETFFHEIPRKELPSKVEPAIPVLRNITTDELNKLFLDVGQGLGKCEISFIFDGEKFTFDKAVIAEIPKEYLA